MILIAKPERHEAAVVVLFVFKEANALLHRGRDPLVESGRRRPGSPGQQIGLPRTLPRRQGAHGVGRQVARAAVERQHAPAATERRPAAVAVLQIEQPLDAATSRQLQPMLLQLRITIARSGQRDQCAGRVVGFRHAARQIGPRPAARLGARVRMWVRVLAVEQPIEAILVQRIGIGNVSDGRSTMRRMFARDRRGSCSRTVSCQAACNSTVSLEPSANSLPRFQSSACRPGRSSPASCSTWRDSCRSANWRRCEPTRAGIRRRAARSGAAPGRCPPGSSRRTPSAASLREIRRSRAASARRSPGSACGPRVATCG